MWLSLFVAALCVVAMFLISWPVALITIAIVLGFYLAVWYRHPDVNWGSSSQAMNYREALTSMQQLAYTEEHVKNYRPQILALTGSPGSRPALIDFAYLICKQNSMLICSQIEKVFYHYSNIYKIINSSFKLVLKESNDVQESSDRIAKGLQILANAQNQRILFTN